MKHKAHAPELPMEGETFTLVGERGLTFDGEVSHDVPEDVQQQWLDYERRVRSYERQGLTRSDAQSAIDAEEMRKKTP